MTDEMKTIKKHQGLILAAMVLIALFYMIGGMTIIDPDYRYPWDDGNGNGLPSNGDQNGDNGTPPPSTNYWLTLTMAPTIGDTEDPGGFDVDLDGNVGEYPLDSGHNLNVVLEFQREGEAGWTAVDDFMTIPYDDAVTLPIYWFAGNIKWRATALDVIGSASSGALIARSDEMQTEIEGLTLWNTGHFLEDYMMLSPDTPISAEIDSIYRNWVVFFWAWDDAWMRWNLIYYFRTNAYGGIPTGYVTGTTPTAFGLYDGLATVSFVEPFTDIPDWESWPEPGSEENYLIDWAWENNVYDELPNPNGWFAADWDESNIVTVEVG